MAEFIDRVSELASRTKKILDIVAGELEQSGLASQARVLRVVAKEHAKLLHDCLTTTQPISIRSEVASRIVKTISEINELSSATLDREKEARDELEKASKILQDALRKIEK